MWPGRRRLWRDFPPPTNNSSQCPNILVQKGTRIYLYNTKIAKVPGVNPIEFENLEDYVEFLKWQRSQGMRCPVLYLQHSYDAQGESSYKIRPSITDLHGGLPPSSASASYTKLVDATQNDQPYNKNSYPAYDQSSYYVGTTTPLDKQTNLLFDYSNPMSDEWKGQQYTKNLVDSGYFKENEVSIAIT